MKASKRVDVIKAIGGIIRRDPGRCQEHGGILTGDELEALASAAEHISEGLEKEKVDDAGANGAERKAWIAAIEDGYPNFDQVRSDWRDQSDYYLKLVAADAQEKIDARIAERIAAATEEQRANAKAGAPEGETARRDAMVKRNRNAWKADANAGAEADETSDAGAEADETTDERSKRDAMIRRNQSAWKRDG
jgi:hypothetical protein